MSKFTVVYEQLQDADWLRAQAEAGRSMADVAVDVGCTTKAVWCAARRHRVRFEHGATMRLPVSTIDAMRAEYVTGTSCAAIGRHFGVSRSKVRNLRDRFGWDEARWMAECLTDEEDAA